jgi:hypothetical protein
MIVFRKAVWLILEEWYQIYLVLASDDEEVLPA